ncbi:MAG: hypothetical protein ACJ761_02755 [Chloroflexota bacterium]
MSVPAVESPPAFVGAPAVATPDSPSDPVARPPVIMPAPTPRAATRSWDPPPIPAPAAATVPPWAQLRPPAGAYVPPPSPAPTAAASAIAIGHAAEPPPVAIFGRTWDPGAARARLLRLAGLVDPGAPRPATLETQSAAQLATAGTVTTVGDDAAEVPINRVEAAVTWLAAAGAIFVTVGLLLPWSDYLIGADGPPSYFDRWGLGSPGHLLLLLAGMSMIGLEIVPSRVPSWLRTGIGGLVLGSLVLGVLWPYLIGPLGAGVGVLTAAAGSVLLIAAGLGASWESRHSSHASPV